MDTLPLSGLHRSFPSQLRSAIKGKNWPWSSRRECVQIRIGPFLPPQLGSAIKGKNLDPSFNEQIHSNKNRPLLRRVQSGIQHRKQEVISCPPFKNGGKYGGAPANLNHGLFDKP